MMETDGQIIGAEINSLVMQLNGTTPMAMGTVTTGTIPSGIPPEILNGLENLLSMPWSQTNVLIHQLRTLMMKDVQRVRRILTGMV